MSYKYEHPRYVPNSRTNDMITGIKLAQIDPVRTIANTSSHMAGVTRDSRFNPELAADVNYSPKVAVNVAQHAPTPTKYTNNYRSSNSVSLYDPRVYNKEEIPFFANNTSLYQLADNAKNKIYTKPALNNPAYDNGNYAGNGFVYNPNLPPSETNKPTYTAAVDERLHVFHTNDREYNYGRERAILADNLRHSDDIRKRNEREWESERALRHNSKFDRDYEPKQTYRQSKHSTLYNLGDDVIRDSSAQNDRNNVSQQHADVINTTAREEFDATDINHLTDAIDTAYGAEFDRRLIANTFNANFRSRSEQFSNDDRVDTARGNQKTNIIEQFIDYIGDTVMGAFGWNKNIDRSVDVTSKESYIDPKRKQYELQMFDEDGSLRTEYNTDIDVPSTETQGVFDSGQRRDIYDRRDHMLVIKNGNMIESYPDEMHEYTAVTFVDKDPTTQHGFNRHMVVMDNGKLLLVQKRAEDAIFDGSQVDNDLIVIELPLEAVDYKVRDKIRKLNLGNKRDKVLELTYDEFVMFRDYIVKHPELHERLKIEQLHYRVRGNTYDEDIVTNFEGKKTFTSDAVYNDIARHAREHLIQHIKGRVDKEIDTTPMVSDVMSPVDRNIKRESMPKNPLTIPRVVGVKRNQFDSIRNV